MTWGPLLKGLGVVILTAGTGLMLISPTRGAEGAAAGKPEAKAATDAPAAGAAPAGKEDTQSAAGVVDSMLKQMQKNPLIEPTERPAADPKSATSPLAPTPRADIDPRVVGVAPGMAKPKLRREGEFVVNRRGRLLRATDGVHLLFVFDADTTAGEDPPMILVPCQYLQSMEQFILERGDAIRFQVSGQILTYRGANYLLLTMMKLASDRGNLTP
ncbi:MAG: hypothetical protein IT440_12675 [Phycisphaeraceae bacterium]|nr:hypothetical protein [Phycisphaeraceae bacterium]